MSVNIADLRENYSRAGLQREDLAPSPFDQFDTWFQQAVEARLPEPNAMILATANGAGKVFTRTVLLKAFDERGFVFYTNYESRKGQDLANNPWAACVFWWEDIERQIRIEGHIEKTSPQQSDAYFFSRPQPFQLAAIASKQSTIITDRQSLESNYQKIKEKYLDELITRPPNWGGCRLIPNTLEFWQGGADRLHDRFEYRKNAQGEWQINRLSP